MIGTDATWTPSYAFDSFEHRYIGDEAFRRATEHPAQYPLPPNFFTKHNPDFDEATKALWGAITFKGRSSTFSNLGNYSHELPLSFGDLAALGGDFSGSADDLQQLLHDIAHPSRMNLQGDPRFLATRRQWEHACAWLKETRSHTTSLPLLSTCLNEILNPENTAIEKSLSAGTAASIQRFATSGYQASRSEASEFEKLPNYSNLASHNQAHFPSYSWKEYGKNHVKALNSAACYGLRKFPKASQQGNQGQLPKECSNTQEDYLLLVQALLYEGYAQHFLQDSFASGHLGSPYSCLLYVICTMITKDYTQHTHDVLNRIGLVVQVPNPLPMGSIADSDEWNNLSKILQEGWTAFGDRHLLIPEASFHRYLVILYATESLREVFNAISSNAIQCDLCNATVFPIPVGVDVDKQEVPWLLGDGEGKSPNTASPEFTGVSVGMLRNLYLDDDRIPPLNLEGWKFQVTYGNLAKLKPPAGLGQPGGVDAVVSTATFELGYVRSTDWWVPNYLGAGVLYSSTVISVYPVSLGYWFNPYFWCRPFAFCDGNPFTIGIRMNAGFQTAEPSTQFNPSSSRSTLAEITGVMDIRYQLYGPLAFYTRLEFVRANGTTHIPWQASSGFTGGIIGTTFGLSFDLAGILEPS
jgi:hypothetical protein